MEFALCGAAFFSCYLGFPASSLLLRCGLSACLRFSPRAALGLSSVASLCACLAALLERGGLRAAPSRPRSVLIPCAFAGGTLGRSFLLMTVARFSGSLTLTRVQAIPLLLLCLLALLPSGAQPSPELEQKRPAFGLFCLLCAMIDGFLGAGGCVVFSLFYPQGVLRRQSVPSAPALLLTLSAQAGALALTLSTGSAQVFPPRMLISLAFGAALGAFAAGMHDRSCGIKKERGADLGGLRTALKTYLILAALSGIEQAFLI